MKRPNNLKIAIIGAGPAGLACALECERLGVIPDVFERSDSVGWLWPSVIILMNVLETGMGGDIRTYLRDYYRIDVQPQTQCDHLIMKSANAKADIKGNLGLFYGRGKSKNSLENQMADQLKRTAIHYNRFADYKELSQKYDYVVVATGKDTAAKELDVWQDFSPVHIRGGIAYGDFRPSSTTLFWNTDYAGQGYARVTPIDSMKAIVGVYSIGKKELDNDANYTKFIEYEGLEHLEWVFKIINPVFSTGKVKKFQVGNVLLAGRSAGLTDRLMGAGCLAAIGSGVFAARAMIKGEDYDKLVKPIQNHIENISAFRGIIERLDNNGLDKMITVLNTPGIKQTMYSSGINFVDAFGSLLKNLFLKSKE